MKKALMMCFMLVIAFFIVGCNVKNNIPDIKNRLHEEWNVQLPDTTEEIYNCYQPTFTGRAYQYAVLTCNDAALEELKVSFAFHSKDSSSGEKLESFFKIMKTDKKYKVDETYVIDLSENYTYCVLKNSIWLILNESSTELAICIFGY